MVWIFLRFISMRQLAFWGARDMVSSVIAWDQPNEIPNHPPEVAPASERRGPRWACRVVVDFLRALMSPKVIENSGNDQKGPPPPYPIYGGPYWTEYWRDPPFDEDRRREYGACSSMHLFGVRGPSPDAVCRDATVKGPPCRLAQPVDARAELPSCLASFPSPMPLLRTSTMATSSPLRGSVTSFPSLRGMN